MILSDGEIRRDLGFPLQVDNLGMFGNAGLGNFGQVAGRGDCRKIEPLSPPDLQAQPAFVRRAEQGDFPVLSTTVSPS